MNIKNMKWGLCCLIAVLVIASCGKKDYQEIKNDPMQARVYTLDNGLKVYMSVYKDAPQVQTYIAVRAGSKNDPAESTGLAHYFEHLMFKGTQQVGTKDWATEKPMLDEIERLFEVYRVTTDMEERTKIYAQIDSVSHQASKLAIANEYDKLMSLIGSRGSNAWTSNDETVYTECIPSNQIEAWAMIQADRFDNATIRIFHTELETVYEEKNRSLTNDNRRVGDTVMAALFPHHTYGTRTTLGTIEHLKNPSITNIKKFFETYYVPNNMAICLSGDFDPDATIEIIRRHFGKLERKEIPELKQGTEVAITKPIVKEIIGPEAENVSLYYRLPAGLENRMMTEFIGNMLFNSTAGLIDLNINQTQKTLVSYAYGYGLSDYSFLVLGGQSKEGQTLEEVKDLMIAEIDKIKKGEFEDWLVEATINATQLSEVESLQSNGGRVDAFLDAFINNIDWADYVGRSNKLKAINKQAVVDWANQKLGNNYVVAYKRTGEHPLPKIEKPQITPVDLDRDSKSSFFKQVEEVVGKAPAIEPVFFNMKNDIKTSELDNNIELRYKHNNSNEIFSMYYVYEMGSDNNLLLPLAFNYLEYLGTPDMTPENFKIELYKLGCRFMTDVSHNRSYITLSGLSGESNGIEAIKLIEKLITNPVANEDALANLINDIKKTRADSKLRHSVINSRLTNYGIWGPSSSTTYNLSNAELDTLSSKVLINTIKDLLSYNHSVWYYGPQVEDYLKVKLNALHVTKAQKTAIPMAKTFEQQATDENKVYFVNYDSKQVMMTMISRGELFDATIIPTVKLYNEYFSQIAYQELREARGLAYSAYSYYAQPSVKKEYFNNIAGIGTQNDKLKDATDQFSVILTDMPVSVDWFDIAKESVLNRIRANRVTKENALWTYDYYKRLGLDYDINEYVFSKVQTMTMEDLQRFQNDYIKGKKHNYCILGNEKELDMKLVNSLGKIQKLTLEEIFGY